MTDKEALQMCLEYIETDAHERRYVRHAIKQALAAPVQEPVAWRYDLAKYRENDLRGRQWAHSVFSPTKPYIDEMVRNLTPLYTTPPAAKRPWIGLTKTVVGNYLRVHPLGDQSTFRTGFKEGVAFAELKLKKSNI
jgi:hypothetical protein